MAPCLCCTYLRTVLYIHLQFRTYRSRTLPPETQTRADHQHTATTPSMNPHRLSKDADAVSRCCCCSPGTSSTTPKRRCCAATCCSVPEPLLASGGWRSRLPAARDCDSPSDRWFLLPLFFLQWVRAALFRLLRCRAGRLGAVL